MQGLRLFVVSNVSSQLSPVLPNIEHWAVYDADAPVRSYSDTATRNALGPFLAYSSLGDSFKWAYFGTLNTDTAFFPEAAARAVAGLDPDEPYFLTGDACSLHTSAIVLKGIPKGPMLYSELDLHGNVLLVLHVPYVFPQTG